MTLMMHGMILTVAIEQSCAVPLWCNTDAAHVEHNSVCTMTPAARKILCCMPFDQAYSQEQAASVAAIQKH